VGGRQHRHTAIAARPAPNAVVHASIADLARLVDILAGEAEVGGGGQAVPVWNGFSALSVAGNLPPLLRRLHFNRPARQITPGPV
jgi:hypothetical protein